MLCAAGLTGARAGNWPQFRGPDGQARTEEKDLPLEWDAKTGKNIAWKAALPAGDNQYSSPVVWGERVFVTGVRNSPPAHWVQCFSVRDGKPLWRQEVTPGPLVLTDLRGGYGAPTPCTDGERVYTVFGSAVVAAFTVEGKPVWRKEIANHAFDVALGSSPVIYKDTVILNCDQTGKTSSIIAYGASGGDIRWEAKRPDTGFAHSTPVFAAVEGKTHMLVNASRGLQGIDPESGKILWWCAGQGDAASPAFGEGLVFSDSGRGGPGMAVEAGGSGDVSGSRIKWTVPQISEGLSSPVIAGGCVWRTHGPEILKAFRLTDGHRVISERLKNVSTWASPFATADGRIYFASAGTSYVVRAAGPLEVLAVNQTGEEDRASAAVSGGSLFLRGDKHLYCIRKTPP